MVSNGKNGAYNSQESGGGFRGTPTRTRTRLGMKLIQRQVEALESTPQDMAEALAHAKDLANNKNTNERTRVRAIELVASICRAAAAMGVDLDKMERLESEDATERVESREVTVRVPKVGRISDE